MREFHQPLNNHNLYSTKGNLHVWKETFYIKSVLDPTVSWNLQRSGITCLPNPFSTYSSLALQLSQITAVSQTPLTNRGLQDHRIDLEPGS